MDVKKYMRICLNHEYLMGFKINHMDNDGFIWFMYHPSDQVGLPDCWPEAKFAGRYLWKYNERYGRGTPRYLHHFKSDFCVRNRMKRLIQ